ncbi:phage lytic cycle repressor MrpR family protein [Viridibacillus arvi]|uniref:phage lytic cycle repressor MrpR family protein n=1 Tax=Viridibacillus arvi TaxID=263475 RepID=UPI0034CE7993
MTKLDMEKVNQVKSNLDGIINGINAISVLRDRVESAMEKVVDPVKVKSILDKKETIDNLNETEIISFFRVIFNQIKDQAFNPDNFIIETKEVKKKSKTKDKKKPSVNDNKNIFHPKFKEQFLKEHRTEKGEPYADETKRVAIVLFGKVGKIESYYNKDIYSFDNNQFEEVLMSLKATTIRSLQNLISTLEQYIDFAIKENKIPASVGNIATRYNTGSVISQFLDKKAEENMIFTKSEIDSLSSYSLNAQDGVILNLLFDGVSHKKKFLELRNITINHVDRDSMVINIPQLVDEDNGEVLPERQVPISSETLRMIDSAMNEDKYTSLNGNSSRKYKIAESDYILRGLRQNFQIKWENVGQRILRIAELEGYDYLNATNIAYSGQIHYARELMSEGLTIDEACAKIIERFNLAENESAHFYLKGRIEKANKILNN